MKKKENNKQINFVFENTVHYFSFQLLSLYYVLYKIVVHDSEIKLLLYVAVNGGEIFLQDSVSWLISNNLYSSEMSARDFIQKLIKRKILVKSKDNDNKKKKIIALPAIIKDKICFDDNKLIEYKFIKLKSD